MSSDPAASPPSNPANSSTTVEIGTLLKDRYRVTDKIGRGGMGKVYRATDTVSGEEVAVKVLSSDLSLEPEMVERFQREGKALRQLKHPNIVNFIDMFDHNEQHVILAEYVAGGSLLDLVKKGPLPVSQVQHIALDLCDALTRAHRMNIIHRDLKPANILLGLDGSAKLTDFGIARLVDESTHLTRTGMVVGTPHYIAPEIWTGEASDARSDIWSLGVVFYEMLTGIMPFEGDSLVKIMQSVLNAPIPDIRNIRRETPEALVNIIKRMLTHDRSKRYQTIREVAVDLERIVPTQSVPAPTPVPIPAAPPPKVNIPARPPTPAPGIPRPTPVPASLSGSIALPARPSSPGTPRPTPIPQPRKKSLPGWVWVVAILGILGASALCIILFGAMLFQPKTPGTTTPTAVSAADATRRNVQSPRVAPSNDARQALIDGAATLLSKANEDTSGTLDEVGKTYQFTVDLNKSEPLLLLHGWCTKTPELLQKNFRYLNYAFEVDGTHVPQDKVAIEAEYQGQTGSGENGYCRAMYVLLDNWPAGEHQVVATVTFTQSVDDGWQTYPQGSFTYLFTVNVGP